jgi:hypothetical protein
MYLERVTDELTRIHQEVSEDFLLYHNKVSRTLSPHLRHGVIPRIVARELMPWHLRFDLELTASEQRDAIELLSRQELKRIPTMSAHTYFEYCRIAYLANPATFSSPWSGPFDPSLSGRELYQSYADGRCGALLDIDPNSEEAFREWHAGTSRAGGHPWEIYRGGNATHITLAAMLDRDTTPHSWRVVLDAFSSTRLVETVRIALALKRAGLPFEVAHHESLRARLACEDLIGIVPNGDDLRYGWHRFPREFNVADCVYFDSLRPGERMPPVKLWSVVKGLVNWLPLEPLKIAKIAPLKS